MKTIKQFTAYGLPSLIMFAFLIPGFANAQTFTCPAIKNIGTLFQWGTCMISSAIIPLLFAVALVAFIYGVVNYIMNPNNSEKRSEGQQYMIWGIVGLFVMVSVWGLVGVLSNTFSLTNTTPTLPTLPQ